MAARLRASKRSRDRRIRRPGRSAAPRFGAIVVIGVVAVVGSVGLGAGSDARAGVWTDPCRAAPRMGEARPLSIIMNVAATDAEIAGMRAHLDRSPLVRRYRFIDKAKAYRELTRIFRKNPDLVANVDADALPVEFRVTPKRNRFIPRLERETDPLPGVDVVASSDLALRRELRRLCREYED